ncbi:MAG: FecR family protein [Chlorobi bacterium]|nr:FecR family protein [Chlorobiota bacterium]
MQERGEIKDSDKSYSKFFNYRKNLSEDERIREAGALLNEIKRVDVDSAYNKVKYKIDKQYSISVNKTLTWITRIAAILAIPLLLLNIWNFMKSGDKKFLAENNFTLQEITSPIGIRTHVILPDGSDIWLNAGSKMSYKIPFVRETRKINLIGEAFLNVTKNKLSPFIVKTENTQVKVLGTKFNVKSYPEDNNIEISLTEGSVMFYFRNKQGRKVYTKLKPNQHLVLNKINKKVTVRNEKLSKYISWHKNILIFDDTPIQEVAKTLERWYGVKVVITDEEIRNYKFTTVFENEPLSRVLELLELTSPISIKYNNGKVNTKTNKLSKSIVTISKK